MNGSEYVYVGTDKLALEAVDFLKQHSRLGYDVETTGLDILDDRTKLLLIQLGTEDIAYLFDCRKIDILVLKEIIESTDILKIGHNLKFDYQAIVHEAGMVLTNMFDTMLAYRLLTAGLIEDGRGGFLANGFRDKNKKRFPYKSLAFLVEKYLGIVLDKTIRESFVNHPYDRDFSSAQLKYAAEDVLFLHPLCDILSQQLAEEDLIDTAILEFEFIAPVAEMELNGVFIDTERWRKVVGEAERQAKDFANQATSIIQPLEDQNTLFGVSTVNISSQDQLLAAFSKLGVTLKNTDKKTLKACKHGLADIILNFRAYEKLISTYGENVLRTINKNTNRLHFTLHQLGADTGRLSSKDPNIQNIPNDKDDPNTEVKISFRDCFIAEPGNKILTADYSQCELRILAEVSQDKRFKEIFYSGGDLHIITSQDVFSYSDDVLEKYKAVKPSDAPGVDLNDLFDKSYVESYTKVKGYRDKTKTINFGIVYGLSAFSLAERFKIPQTEAEGILENYFKMYSGIKKWIDKNGHDCIVNRHSRTLLGRKRYYRLPNPEEEEEFRRSKGAIRRAGNNAVIQGTNADITKEALIRLQEAYRDIEGAKLLFTVHDEIVSECPQEKVELVAEIKAEVMCQAFHRFVKTVPVGPDDKVSVTIADCWSK